MVRCLITWITWIPLLKPKAVPPQKVNWTAGFLEGSICRQGSYLWNFGCTLTPSRLAASKILWSLSLSIFIFCEFGEFGKSMIYIPSNRRILCYSRIVFPARNCGEAHAASSLPYCCEDDGNIQGRWARLLIFFNMKVWGVFKCTCWIYTCISLYIYSHVYICTCTKHCICTHDIHAWYTCIYIHNKHEQACMHMYLPLPLRCWYCFSWIDGWFLDQTDETRRISSADRTNVHISTPPNWIQLHDVADANTWGCDPVGGF